MFESLIDRFVIAAVLVLDLFSYTSKPRIVPIHTLRCTYNSQDYRCRPELTQIWGQYSPWFSAPSEISRETPRHCNHTFTQVLSRHGSRYPTSGKGLAYRRTIEKIHNNVQHYRSRVSFIEHYRYSLDVEHLTKSGQIEMMKSGADFYNRYSHLATKSTPFIRASGQERVIDSARNWTYGYQLASSDQDTNTTPMVVISEVEGSNNSLNHGLCNAFENGPHSHTAFHAQRQWAAKFVPPVQERLNADLPGANLTAQDIIHLMDLCPYETIASSTHTISPFCAVFTAHEWQQYDYYESLNKYYGHGAGNPLGPTQGVGFTNELIARMTNRPVRDHTSTNHTLNRNPATFPLGRTLYADFSHDNDMTGVLFAMGLYESTKPLSNVTMETVQEMSGYSAAYTVPFAARVYFEKLTCEDSPGEEMVRVLVNDRVLPLEKCGGDHLGRCLLSRFIESLDFAARDGLWSQCDS